MSGIAVKNSKYEVLTPTGWQNFVGVRKSISTNLRHITIDDEYELTCTKDHLLQTKQGMVEVCNIGFDHEINTASGYKNVLALNTLSESRPVYDLLEVDDGNLYYTNNIVSHNCAFLGSSGTLISGATLKTLVAKVPLHQHDGLKMYIEPEVGHSYVIVVDVSRGKGLDYSAFQVIDTTQMPYNQVCTYKNNMVTPVDFAEVIHRLSRRYNEATILVEINDVGQQVADTLYSDYDNENIIYTESAGARGKRISTGSNKTSDRGVRTTKTVKAIGCSMLKLLIEQYQLIINDHDTIWELSRFSKKGNSYEAESGAHDDLAMCLVLFAWMSDQQYFKDLTDINTLMKLRDKSEEDIERDLLPFGIIDDGHEQYQEVVELPRDELAMFIRS